MAIKSGLIGAAEAQSERVTTIGVEEVWQDIQGATELYNEQIDMLVEGVVERMTAHQINFKLPGNSTLQPLDDWGNPQPTYEDGQYTVAFPIVGAGDAWGNNRVSRALMTVQQVSRQVEKTLRADADWMRRHILAAWFTNVTYTYTDDEFGSLTIQPLANGDTVTYLRRDGTSATDNHFLGQANTISNTDNPFSTIYRELDEHPSNSGPYVAFVPTNLTDEIEALDDLIPPNDPSLIISENNTRLRIGIDPDNTEFGEGPVYFGQRYLGRCNGVHIVEWTTLPDNYIVAIATGADEKPFGMREYPADEITGLFPEFNDRDGNSYEFRWVRYCGFGALNRIAALAMEIGDASYDIPTGFTAPLPR